MNRKEHWNEVYETKAPDDVSWFETRPATSLRLIQAAGVNPDDGIIDVGGGASVLVDFLLDSGYRNLAVMDLSGAALEHARKRLGERAGSIEWFEADVTEFLPPRRYGLWHDRAVFHFLTDPADRRKYLQTLMNTLVPQGQVVLAAFAMDGPPKCSGLNVARYDAPAIAREFGAEFELVEDLRETHVTPWNTQQNFNYFRFRRKAG